jgi:hypothetical protein
LILALGLSVGALAGVGGALVQEFAARVKIGDSLAYGEFQRALADAKGDLLGLRSRGTNPSVAESDPSRVAESDPSSAAESDP